MNRISNDNINNIILRTMKIMSQMKNTRMKKIHFKLHSGYNIQVNIIKNAKI